MVTLRNYQMESVNLTRVQVAKGRKRNLLVLPTGGGKTIVMAEMARRAVEKGGRVLCLMHRRQLVDQMVERFKDHGLDCGVIMAGVETNLSSPIQIATIQTYGRRIKLDDAGIQLFFVAATLILIDEAHRSLSNIFQKVLKYYADKTVIGVTATPCLSSGLGMGQYYDSLVAPVGVRELVRQGYLVPARYFAPTKPDLKEIPIVQGDFETKALGKVMNTSALIGDVLENWLRIASGLQTIVFAVNVSHSKALCLEFQRNGVQAEHLDAHSSDDERDQVLQALFNKKIQVVFNVALYTEGFDYPGAECIVLARPTKSMGLYRQMAGRGLRTHPGKCECIIIDHGGCIDRLGFIDDPVVWTLDGKELAWSKTPPRKKETSPITCEMCWAVFKGRRCPNCGYEIKDYGRRIEAIDAQLQEIRSAKKAGPSWEEKARWWGMFEYHRRIKDYVPGWTAHKYREKFGEWPESHNNVAPIEPDLEFKNWMKYLVIKWRKGQHRVREVA